MEGWEKRRFVPIMRSRFRASPGVPSYSRLCYLCRQISFGRCCQGLESHMNRLALLLLCCAAWSAPYVRADDASAMAVLRAGCTADVQRLCANVPPGGGRILACLRQHKDALSDRCKQAAQQASSMS